MLQLVTENLILLTEMYALFKTEFIPSQKFINEKSILQLEKSVLNKRI